MKSNLELSQLKYVLCVLVFVSAVIVSCVAIFLYVDSGLYSYDFCFKTECVKKLFSTFSLLPDLIDFLMKIFVAIATILGVIYAFESYQNSASTSRLNVYLLHLNTFKEYLLKEVEKEPRLNSKSINVIKWYNLAFPKSRNGSLEVGAEYISMISDVILVVEESNRRIAGKEPGKLFDYKNHQEQIILKFRAFGINIQRMPKNDFFETELEVISLVNKINRDFCMGSELPILVHTKFR